jgi:beta-glucosidase
VLIGGRDGKPRRDFAGKLSFSWPKRLDQYVLNKRDPNYDPLFPIGYGLTYAAPRALPRLDETRPAGVSVDQNALFVRGRLAQGPGWFTSGSVAQARIDRRSQEDSVRLTWTGQGKAGLALANPIDLRREVNGELSLIVEYRAAAKPANVTVSVEAGKTASVPVASLMTAAPGEWGEFAVPLRCFADGGADMEKVARPFILSTNAPLRLDISGVRVASAPAASKTCPR